MSYMRIVLAAIHVSNEQDARAAWRVYGGPASIVGTFVCESPLTARQLRRLPKGLRERLRVEVPA